jgi:hypothetical protein
MTLFYRERAKFAVRDQRLGLIGSRRELLEVPHCQIISRPVARHALELQGRVRADVTLCSVGDEAHSSLDDIDVRLPLSDDGLYMYTRAAGFAQANRGVVRLIVDEVAGFVGQGPLWELYGGSGTFGVPLAARGVSVVSQEVDPVAVRLACRAAHEQQLLLSAHCSHAGSAVLGVERCKVALVNPPRRGCAPQVRLLVNASVGVDKLAYVSCNPFTLARDLLHWEALGWTVDRVVPFDMFPQTRHVEVLALMKRTGGSFSFCSSSFLYVYDRGVSLG